MTQKSFNIENIKQAQDEIPDLKVYGNGDTWVLLCKASSEAQGWMKSTKVMNVPGGCVIQVTTQQLSHGVIQDNGYVTPQSYALAEAVTFVPGVQIIEHADGERVLVERRTG